uniref:Mitochondrial ribosomal protein L13 n=1 Tax=Plectus sambesii TaxID=2011161 RepID=A0A914ULC9_9BILA
MGMTRLQRVQQWLVFARQWHIVDAQGQDIDRLGEKVARFLKGAHKPIYHPETDCGDHVVVYNCRQVAMKGFEWKHREYFFNREYPRSKNLLSAWEIHEFDPCRLMFLSVYQSLGRNLVRRRHIERLHLFADDEIPPRILQNVSNQMEQVQSVPRRSDQISAEERSRFPAIFDWKEDHLVDWEAPRVPPAEPTEKKK